MAKPDNEELWRTIFGVGHPLLKRYQRLYKKLPSAPRCKLCYAPFKGIGGFLMKFTKRGPSNRNPRFCSRCDQFIRSYPGGAEVEVSMVFVDVRGSTNIAENMSATEYAKLINQFYVDSTKVFIETDGFMMDVVGDEVFALYPPGFSGEHHASLAVTAAQKLINKVDNNLKTQEKLTFGVGVHTGKAYIGTINGAEEGIVDVRVLGDAVNTAARICACAAPGEALISNQAYQMSNLDNDSLEQRQLNLKGKSKLMNVRVLSS